MYYTEMLQKLPKALITIITALLYIVPFVPLFLSDSLLFPYITGRTFLFRIAVEIALALWLGLALIDKEYRPRWTPITIALTLFLAIMGIADAFGANPYRSFWSNYERMEGFVGLLHLGAYFLLLATVFRSKEWKAFFHLTILSAALNGLVGLFQKLGVARSIQGGFRVEGLIGNPTYFAAYLLLVSILTLLLFVRAKEKWMRYLYGGLFVFFMLIVYFTATRGVAAAIVLAALLFAAFYLRLGPKSEKGKGLAMGKKVALGALAVAIIVPGSLWLLRDTSLVKRSETLSRMTSFSFTDKTTRARFMIWGMALQATKERPILGWGQENFAEPFVKYYNPNLFDQEAWFDRAHNAFLDWLTAGGIMGLLSYLFLFGSAVWILGRAWHKKAFTLTEALILAVGLFAYFFQNLVVFDSLVTYLLFFTILAYIYHRLERPSTVLKASGDAIEEREEKGKFILPAGLGAALLLALIVLLSKNLSLFSTAALFIYGIVALAYLFTGGIAQHAQKTSDALGGRALMGSGGLLIVMGIIVYFANIIPIAQAKDLIALLNARMSQESVPDIIEKTQAAVDRGGFGTTEIREQMGTRAQEILDPRFVAFILNQFEDQLRSFPNDPRARLFAATLYTRAATQNPEYLRKAGEHLQYAIDHGQKRQLTYHALAEYFLRGNDVERALAAAQTAVNLAPQFDEPYAIMVQIAILGGRRDATQKILAARHTEPVLLRAADTYTQIKNDEAAIKLYEELTALSPTSTEYHARLVGAYQRVKRYDDAIREAKILAELDPAQFAEGAKAFIEEMRKLKSQ